MRLESKLGPELSCRSTFSAPALLAAALALGAPPAAAQTAYVSTTGNIFSSGSQISFFFDVSRSLSSSETVRFQTFTSQGGTNAAGDAIANGSGDSVLALFNPGNAEIAFDDGGAPGTDALINFNTGDPSLPNPLPAATGYRLELTDFDSATGPYAVDLVAPADAFTFTPAGASTLSSLKLGTTGPGTTPAVVNQTGTFIVPGPLVVAQTGHARFDSAAGTTTTFGGLVTVNTNGTLNANGDVFNANGGVNINGGTLNANGDINVDGVTTIGSNGNLHVEGRVTFMALGEVINNGTMSIDNFSFLDFRAGFTNNGTLRLNDGPAGLDGLLMLNPSGTFEIGRDGTGNALSSLALGPAGVQLGGELNFNLPGPVADYSFITPYGVDLITEILSTELGTSAGVFATVTGHVFDDADANGDGQTALAVIYDFVNSVVEYQRVLYGDGNLDGFISQSDLDAVLLNWGMSNLNGNNDGVSWVTGDYDGNGFIGQADLDAVLLNWGGGTPPAINAIPEPSTLAAIALLSLVGLRRCH